MYRVIEAAEQLGVSKVTVYKKIRQMSDELGEHVFKRSRITYLDEHALELLRKNISMSNFKNLPFDALGEAFLRDYLLELQALDQFLTDQVQAKEEQLMKKREQLRTIKHLLER
jgi:transposase